MITASGSSEPGQDLCETRWRAPPLLRTEAHLPCQKRTLGARERVSAPAPTKEENTNPATHQPLQWATGQHTGTPRRPRFLHRSRHRPSVIVLASRGHRSRTRDGQRTLEAFIDFIIPSHPRTCAAPRQSQSRPIARTHRTDLKERTWISELELQLSPSHRGRCIQP
ncbi:hypothetical protein VTO73DRAFT_5264 [Trametes versicolor]